MKTAKEMFEELGFTQRMTDGFIYYSKKDETLVGTTDNIDFYNKTIFPHKEFKTDGGYYNSHLLLSIDILNAINKQVEELDWNEQ